MGPLMSEEDAARLARKRRFARWRIGFLSVVLLVVVSWAVGVTVRRHRLHDWSRPVNATVIVVSTRPVSEERVHALESSLSALEAVLGEQYGRYTDSAGTPLRFSVVGPLVVSRPPPYPDEHATLVGRAMQAFDLYRYMHVVDEHVGPAAHGADVRVYVTVEPGGGGPRFVEGVATKGGDFGLVRVVLSEDMVDQAALAIAHEVFHCLGATDKYDAAGHAQVPGGLVDPEQVPRYPQRRAAVMVGEVPLGPARGRLIQSVDEVGVAPETAREIGWRHRPAGER